MADTEIETSSHYHPTTRDEQILFHLSHWKWWFVVILNIFLLLMGQSSAVMLGRFYYDQGGKSLWMNTLLQTIAFPILFIPLFLFPHAKNTSETTMHSCTHTLIIIYFSLGILLACDNFMYSIGLLYLPVSTYSLICASQLAFNALFSFFINSQKLTFFILNTVFLLTLSASLTALHSDSSENYNTKENKFTKIKHMIGFWCTLGASAGYALLLSLMQLSFEKVLKKETFSIVLEMQIWTCFIASCVSMIGLFASGEVNGLKDEMRNFKAGKVVYILTLVGTCLAWQICYVGVVGLIYIVSSLFSNVMSMLSLPLVPVAAVFIYHEELDGVKIVAMLLAILGFGSYIYQNYLDEAKFKESKNSLSSRVGEV